MCCLCICCICRQQEYPIRASYNSMANHFSINDGCFASPFFCEFWQNYHSQWHDRNEYRPFCCKRENDADYRNRRSRERCLHNRQTPTTHIDPMYCNTFGCMVTEAIKEHVYEFEPTLESQYLAETNQPSHLITRVEEQHMCWPKFMVHLEGYHSVTIKDETRVRLKAPERVRMEMELEIAHVVTKQVLAAHGTDIANGVLQYK